MRRLAIVLIVLVALAGLLMLGAATAFRSPAATAWVLEKAAGAAPGELTLDGIEGSFAEGLTVGRLAYATEGLRAEASDLYLRVHWPALAVGSLRLSTVTASEISLRLEPTGPEPSPEADLPRVALPLDIVVKQAAIDRFRIHGPAFDETLTDIELDAALRGPLLEIRKFGAVARGIRADLAGELALASSWPLRLDLTWQAVDGERSGHGWIRGDFDRLELEHWLKLPAEVRVSGTVATPLRDLDLDLAANWDRLGWPLDGSPDWVATDGGLTLTGAPDDYRVRLSTVLGGPMVDQAEVELDGRGDAAALQVDRLVAEMPQAKLSATGQVDYREPGLQLDLVAHDVDLAWLRPELEGQVGFSASLQAALPGQVELAVADLNGRLFDQTVDGSGRLLIDGDRMEVEGFSLVAGDNRASFDGGISPRLSASLQIDARSLAQLWPGLDGRLQASASLAGSLEEPAVELNAEAAGLAYQGWDVAALNLDLSVKGEQLDVDLEADELGRMGSTLGDLSAEATGSVADHRVGIRLSGADVSASLRSRGSLRDGLLTEVIGDGTLDAGQAGRWRLDGDVTVTAGGGEVHVDGHCWRNEPSSLCIDPVDLTPGRVAAGGRLTGLPLAMIQPWLGGGLTLDGSADAEFRLERAGTQLELSVDWLQTDSRLHYQAAAGERITTIVETLSLNVAGDQQQLSVDGRMSTDAGIDARLSGSITAPLEPLPQLDLNLIFELPDLSAPTPLLDRFLPVVDPKGSVTADMQIQGSPRVPRIVGRAELRDGAAIVPAAGIQLRDMRLVLSGRDGESLSVNGSARSGDGELQVNGELDWSEIAGVYADLRVTGSNFRAIRFPEQTIDISPDVRAHIDAGRVTVSGSLLIPRADIVLDELPATAAEPSADVVVHASGGAEQRERGSPLELVGAVDVSLGERVRFEGFGLETWLEGTLKLARAPGAVAPTAHGVLRTVDGRFQAGGKTLIVERGTLIFSGPLDRPQLDVRASRKIDWQDGEVTAGVLLTGPIDAIETQVFSRPAMSEADALSFLVLDRPASAVQGDASGELSNTAIALGLIRVLPLAEQLEQNLGLDEVGVEGSGGDNTALVAGKRLNSDLSVRYKYALFSRIGTFLIRYRVGRGFSIEAGTGQEQSLDLIYSIDR